MALNGFWTGFHKQATAALTGGSEHIGAGKGNLMLGRYERSRQAGPIGAFTSGPEDTSPRRAKDVYDRVGNPRSHSIFDNGTPIVDDSVPHLIY